MLTFNLEAYRKSKKLTQLDVAKLTGMTQSAISQFEKNPEKVNLSTINKIANKLQVEPVELLGGDAIPKARKLKHDALVLAHRYETIRSMIVAEVEELKKFEKRAGW